MDRRIELLSFVRGLEEVAIVELHQVVCVQEENPLSNKMVPGHVLRIQGALVKRLNFHWL
jgi:hypothetical protein